MGLDSCFIQDQAREQSSEDPYYYMRGGEVRKKASEKGERMDVRLIIVGRVPLIIVGYPAGDWLDPEI